VSIVTHNSLKRLRKKEPSTRPRLGVRTAIWNILPWEPVPFQRVACVTVTGPIMNWRTVEAAIPTRMPLWTSS